MLVKGALVDNAKNVNRELKLVGIMDEDVNNKELVYLIVTKSQKTHMSLVATFVCRQELCCDRMPENEMPQTQRI